MSLPLPALFLRTMNFASMAVFLGGFALGQEVVVHNTAELRVEVQRAKPGTTIRLEGSSYKSGLRIEGVAGSKEKPIIITGADEKNPPVFKGGNVAIQLSECNYITLRNIRVVECTANGINIDDGERYESPPTGLVFENLIIERIGPRGNFDGLKLSGLDGFTVRNCKFDGWGGSAIDMVGCRNGVIDRCQFTGREGYSQSNGVQAKGGSEYVTIRRSFFNDAGHRSINLGGSTGLPYFRPKLRNYEAKAIVVEGNRFVGSMSPIAFVTSVDCVVRQNTIVNPEKWILRILQEQPTEKFKPCQGSSFESNLIVFDQRVRTPINIGPNTLPETFTFRGNAWYRSDSNRRPTLPVKEVDGVYQINPNLKDAASSKSKVGSKDPRLAGIGADAFDQQKAEAGTADKSKEASTSAREPQDDHDE